MTTENNRSRCYTDASKLCWALQEKATAGTHKKGIVWPSMHDTQRNVAYRIVGLQMSLKKSDPWHIFNYCPFCGTHFHTHRHKLSGMVPPRPEDIIDKDVLCKRTDEDEIDPHHTAE